MKATIKIDVDFESWFAEGKEPTTNEEWAIFFNKYFLPDSSVIGDDDGDIEELICIRTAKITTVTTKKTKEEKQ